MRHGVGGDARHGRNTKGAQKAKDAGVARGKMRSNLRHGGDYTPLFRFLLSRVGKEWDEVSSEARARLDTAEPLAWMVAETDMDRTWIVRIGESSYWSGLYVDGQGLLQLVAPDLTLDDLVPRCSCCTHTFNGERFTQAFPGTPETQDHWRELTARFQPDEG